jgi:hypothetical protein
MKMANETNPFEITGLPSRANSHAWLSVGSSFSTALLGDLEKEQLKSKVAALEQNRDSLRKHAQSLETEGNSLKAQNSQLIKQTSQLTATNAKLVEAIAKQSEEILRLRALCEHVHSFIRNDRVRHKDTGTYGTVWSSERKNGCILVRFDESANHVPVHPRDLELCDPR